MSWMDQEMRKAMGIKTQGEILAESLASVMMRYTMSQVQENLRIAREAEARRKLLEWQKKQDAERERMFKTYFRDRASDSLVSQYTYCVVLAQYIAAVGSTKVGLGSIIMRDTGEQGRWMPMMTLNKEYGARADKIKAIVARPNEDIKLEIRNKMKDNLNLTNGLFSKAQFPELWRNAAKGNQRLEWLPDASKPTDDGYLEMRHALIEALAPCLYRASSLETVFKLDVARDDVRSSLVEAMTSSTGMKVGTGVAEEMIKTVRGAVWAARRVA